jgi:hypothetical protein
MKCDCCNYTASTQQRFNVHLLSKKHLTQGVKIEPIFTCEKCNYATHVKGNYKIHCLSNAHLDIKPKKINPTFTCISCDFTTIHKQTYDKHCLSKMHHEIESSIKSYDIDIKLNWLDDMCREENDDIVLYICKRFILGRNCIKPNYVYTDKWVKNESIIADLYERVKVAYIKISTEEQIKNMNCTYNFDELHSIL